MGLAAGFKALWCTFIPCFLWVFAGAPHVDRILAVPRLNAALTYISAAVVGVIANLGIWFIINLVFAETVPTPVGLLPDLTSVDVTAAGLTVRATGLMLRLRVFLLPTLGLCAVAALTASLIGGAL
ncbi:chromate transporter [Shimia sp. Alg240-R146]|uniref:chromate transporter n=1 Tax=Shimia sp. Alg240-R146 TaxID=2993449 RepID=UPI0022E64E87|nr:chromate transporter [Shimia sp. Alg240-R146]